MCEVWFQPIVSTASQRIVAHQCVVRTGSEPEIVPAIIRSAALQSKHGKYFLGFMPSCLQSTLAALEESGMGPENIVFDAQDARRHGFAFAHRNAGIGAASVQIIRDLRPDYIKLDRTLIRNIEQPLYAAAIRQIVEVAGQSGAVLIAEGVDKPEAMENLWLLGVECMQGGLFGRPAPRITRQTPGSRCGGANPLMALPPRSYCTGGMA